jgi:hypothetical protein
MVKVISMLVNAIDCHKQIEIVSVVQGGNMFIYPKNFVYIVYEEQRSKVPALWYTRAALNSF